MQTDLRPGLAVFVLPLLLLIEFHELLRRRSDGGLKEDHVQNLVIIPPDRIIVLSA